MIIIFNQIRESITDCKNVQVTQQCAVVEILQIYESGLNICVILGKYATDARAKEVLSEIWGKMLSWQGDCAPFYQMPQE